uniref:Hint domain-containing protein n=1 Tax=Plectus sambesii TaxID=2011161 RepID=A0A914V7Z9_9BILA
PLAPQSKIRLVSTSQHILSRHQAVAVVQVEEAVEEAAAEEAEEAMEMAAEVEMAVVMAGVTAMVTARVEIRIITVEMLGMEMGKEMDKGMDKETPTLQPAYSRVTGFIHRLPRMVASFHQIHTLNGVNITLTGNHFIFITDCFDVNYRRVFASDVKVGDCVLLLDDDRVQFVPRPVTNITMVREEGIYSPLTETGTIVVNDILASCHSTAGVIGHLRLHQTFFHWTQAAQSWIAWPTRLLNWGVAEDEEEVELTPSVRFILSIFDLLIPQQFVAS